MKNEKILQDEILSDEELENVSGGSWGEFAADIFEAKKRGVADFVNLELNEDNDLIKMIGDDDLRHKYVDKMAGFFASHGITMTYKGKILESNIYTHNGKEISREQAWNIVDGK